MRLAKNKHEFMRIQKCSWQGQGIVKFKKINTACDIQNLLYAYFSADHYEMLHLSSTGQIIDTRT